MRRTKFALTGLCFVAVVFTSAQGRECVAQEPSGADSPPELLLAAPLTCSGHSASARRGL